MEQQLNHRDTATYLAFALGQAMLNSIDVMMHELKTGSKEEQKLHKQKIKDRVRLHQAMNSMFPNAKRYLNTEDVKKLNEAVTGLVDSLWI